MPSDEQQLLPTGISGLDEILHGGLPAHFLYLVKGSPGTGKTSLALQFLAEAARNGESTVYVSFSESISELQAVARSHGWPLDEICVCELADDISRRAVSGSSILHASDVEFPEVLDKILEAVERVEPTRLVIDSLTELRNVAESRRHYRRALFQLKVSLERAGVTSIFVGEKGGQVKTEAESLVHGVIVLDMDTPIYGPVRRRIQVSKLRGRDYESGLHDFQIVTGGIEVFPQIRPKEKRRRQASGARVSSGVAALDDLLGGGLARGTSSLCMGASGTGKSTVVMQYALAAAQRGEKAAIFAFDEDVETIKQRAVSMEVPLLEHMKSGVIRIQSIDAAEMSPGEFAHLVRAQVQEGGVRFVALDSVNGFVHAMPGEQALVPHLHDLLAYLGGQGVVTMLVLTLAGLLRSSNTEIANLSYLADTILLLRYFKRRGEVLKSITAAKHRVGDHQTYVRELDLGRGGIRIGDPVEFSDGASDDAVLYERRAKIITELEANGVQSSTNDD